MPDRTALKEHGLRDDEIEELQSTFLARKRDAYLGRDFSEVERLVTEYDCSRLVIGLVRFNEHLVPLPAGVCFAECEADLLVVTEDGAVGLCDHDHPGSVHLFCAVDGHRFLDGMATFVTMVADCASWMGRGDAAAARCAESAGGPQYSDFFRILCAGFYDL